jgi:hypothetical protein
MNDDPIERLRAKVDAFEAKQRAAAPTGWTRKGWRQPDGSLAPHYGRAMTEKEAAAIRAEVKRKLAAHGGKRASTPPRSGSTGRAMTPAELRKQAAQLRAGGHTTGAELMERSARNMERETRGLPPVLVREVRIVEGGRVVAAGGEV